MTGDDDEVTLADGRTVPIADFLRERGCNFVGVVRVSRHHWHDVSQETHGLAAKFMRGMKPLTEAQRRCLSGDA